MLFGDAKKMLEEVRRADGLRAEYGDDRMTAEKRPAPGREMTGRPVICRASLE